MVLKQLHIPRLKHEIQAQGPLSLAMEHAPHSRPPAACGRGIMGRLFRCAELLGPLCGGDCGQRLLVRPTSEWALLEPGAESGLGDARWGVQWLFLRDAIRSFERRS